MKVIVWFINLNFCIIRGIIGGQVDKVFDEEPGGSF